MFETETELGPAITAPLVDDGIATPSKSLGLGTWSWRSRIAPDRSTVWAIFTSLCRCSVSKTPRESQKLSRSASVAESRWIRHRPDLRRCAHRHRAAGHLMLCEGMMKAWEGGPTPALGATILADASWTRRNSWRGAGGPECVQIKLSVICYLRNASEMLAQEFICRIVDHVISPSIQTFIHTLRYTCSCAKSLS